MRTSDLIKQLADWSPDTEVYVSHPVGQYDFHVFYDQDGDTLQLVVVEADAESIT